MHERHGLYPYDEPQSWLSTVRLEITRELGGAEACLLRRLTLEVTGASQR